MQNFADDFPVGNQNARLVHVQQHGREEFDFCHLPRHAGNLNPFTDAERFGENDAQAGDEIAQHALQGQADADARHADACQRRADGHAQFLQRLEQGHQKDEQPDDAHGQHDNGRLDIFLFQPFPERAPNPPRNDQADGKDDERADDLKAVVGEKSHDPGLDLVNGVNGFGGGISHVLPQVCGLVNPITSAASTLE